MRVAVPLALGVLTITGAARADDILGTAGVQGLVLWSGPLELAHVGVEGSVMRYGGSVVRDPLRFGYGGVAQLGVLGRDGSFTAAGMLGAQVAYGIFGCELGVFGHGAVDGYGANVGVHVSPYASVGVAWVGFVLRVPVLPDASGGVTPEVGMSFGFKVPFTLQGRPMDFDMNFGRGRPLSRGGAPVVAETARGDAWRDAREPVVAGLDDATREALARAWRGDALAEHASVAAFTRVSMQLLAVGAPADLVAAAHESALDEVRHARACFALARAYSGRDESAGPLDVGALREAACDRATIAREALVEGCVGEGAAAQMALVGARRCGDPAARAALDEIARDESAHAAFAARAVAWCLDTDDGAAAAAVAAALDALDAPAVFDDARADVDPAAWRAAGRLSRAEAAAMYAQAVEDVRSRWWSHPALATRRRLVALRRARPTQRARAAEV